MNDQGLTTAAQCAAHGLACAGRMGLPADDPIIALAEAIIDDTADETQLAEIIAEWPAIADRNPHVAGVAWLLSGGSFTRQEVEPISAVADAPTAAETALTSISTRLNNIQRVARAQIQTAMDVSTRAAAERVGRVATQKVTNPDLKNRLRNTPPRLAVAVMGRRVFAALELNEENRIRVALGEGVAVAEQALRDRSSEAVNVVAAEFAVDFDPDPYEQFRTQALTYLQDRATEWAIERLHEPDATTPDRFPPDIIISTLQIAGGSPAPIGTLPNRTGGIAPSLTTGPVFESMLADVFDAYRGAPELTDAS